jgi:DNA repair protein RadC
MPRYLTKKSKKKKNSKRKIDQIPEFDRPREKMISKGPASLSTLELVAALVGSGIPGKDVFVVARDIVSIVEEDFHGLSIEKLEAIEGVGKARGCQIMAAIEFARRFLRREGILINDVEDVLPMVEELRNKRQEYFLTFTLDGGRHLIEKRTVFIGTLNESLIHPREVFADAVTDRAASIVLVHNHTAPGVHPSAQDIQITYRLQDVGKMLGIEVKDHIIIDEKDTFSFLHKGLLRRG